MIIAFKGSNAAWVGSEGYIAFKHDFPYHLIYFKIKSKSRESKNSQMGSY